MLGILHHSPITVSVIFDREHFRDQFISSDEAKSGLWEEKIQDFRRSTRDSRIRVLFVEKLSALQSMIREGLDPSDFKVVLFDDCEVLKAVPGVEIVDQDHEDGTVKKTYDHLPERLRKALTRTPPGVPAETVDFDVQSAAPELPEVVQFRKPRTKSKPAESAHTSEMEQADAVMDSILNDKPLHNTLTEDEPPPESKVETPPEPEDEPPPEPGLNPPPEPVETKPEPKPRKKKAKKAKKKKKKKKKAGPSSHKLF